MDWHEIPAAMDAWSAECSPVCDLLRPRLHRLYTSSPVGIYFNPEQKVAAVYGGEDDAAAAASLVESCGIKVAGALVEGSDWWLDPWVKVAASDNPFGRALAALNFFPGQYPWGQPNHPVPLAAMLTSALVGAGLGWGGGHLARFGLLPKGYGDHLPQTLAVLGGLTGAGLGAGAGAVNLLNGRGFNEPDPFGRDLDPPPEFQAAPDEVTRLLEKRSWIGRLWELKSAGISANSGAGWMPPAGGSASDVHVDTLGRTLWMAQLPPTDSSAVMATMYAAQQLPTSRPTNNEWVTGDQLGHLALRAGSDYLTGMLVGSAINAAVGTPFTSPTIAGAYTAARLVQAVVPKLFGG